MCVPDGLFVIIFAVPVVVIGGLALFALILYKVMRAREERQSFSPRRPRGKFS